MRTLFFMKIETRRYKRRRRRKRTLPTPALYSVQKPTICLEQTMAITDPHLKAPKAPHGITSDPRPYNEWPNEAGVCPDLFHHHRPSSSFSNRTDHL